MSPAADRWAEGSAYERFMGRWSRSVARSFVAWISVGLKAHWLDVGCGTGALTSAICELSQPASVAACDPSEPFIEHARRAMSGAPVSFSVAGIEALPERTDGFDAIVSGLVLNFIPDPAQAVKSMRARLRSQGLLAAYVWDYAAGMEFLRIFWDEAAALDASAAKIEEGARFPLCQAGALASLFGGAGLRQVKTH